MASDMATRDLKKSGYFHFPLELIAGKKKNKMLFMQFRKLNAETTLYAW
jgi:hypothetical protein